MKAVFIFRVCNYLGFSHRVAIVAQTYEEAVKSLNELEYSVKSFKFIGAFAA